MRPNGGLSSSGTQNMQSSTGQYSTHAGEPAHPVQHSVITANSFGFFLRGVVRPLDLGSNFSSSGTIPAGLLTTGGAAIVRIIPESQNDVICVFEALNCKVHRGFAKIAKQCLLAFPARPLRSLRLNAFSVQVKAGISDILGIQPLTHSSLILHLDIFPAHH